MTKVKPKHKADEIFDDKHAEFIRIIAEGGTMRDAATALKCSPALLCKGRANEDNVTLREHYVRARENQADAFADEIVDVARDKTCDPSHARVRIDALKWAAGKRKPKVYGDKLELSGDQDNPFRSVTELRIVGPE